MAHPLTNLGDRSTDYLTANSSNHPPADDSKSSYDDLIDQYAEPYSRISRHQTFKVQTSPIDDSESRGPSYSMEYKSPYPSGKPHDETQDPPGPPQSYPPKIKQEKLVDHRKWWQQVTASLPSHTTSSHLLQDSPRLLGMPALRDNCPCRDDDRSCHRG